MKRLIVVLLTMLLCAVALAEETEMKYDFSLTERDNLLTSQTISVDFSSIWSSRNSRLGLRLSPCSRSVMISSAPAAFSSLVCLFRS